MNATPLPSDILRDHARQMASADTNAAWLLLRAVQKLLPSHEAEVVDGLASLLTCGANQFGDQAMEWGQIAHIATIQARECEEAERGFAA